MAILGENTHPMCAMPPQQSNEEQSEHPSDNAMTEQSSGEGSQSALARMKTLEKAKSDTMGEHPSSE